MGARVRIHYFYWGYRFPRGMDRMWEDPAPFLAAHMAFTVVASACSSGADDPWGSSGNGGEESADIDLGACSAC